VQQMRRSKDVVAPPPPPAAAPPPPSEKPERTLRPDVAYLLRDPAEPVDLDQEFE